MQKFEPAIPNPKNLIHSLRDIGYSLETAMADIIDNSITANASKVNIFIHYDTYNSYIIICDNGIGMNSSELCQAMQLGSFDPLEDRSKKDLGRFGLGLKTASFSQSSKLTVVSKQQNSVIGRIWDLNHISEKKSWEIGVYTTDEINRLPKIELLKNCGTYILWENLDRLIDIKSKRNAEDIFWEKIDSAREHLGLVFHRYITGERGLKKLSITINGDPVQSFDPFEGAGKYFPDEEINNIKIEAYQLPHISKVSNEQYRKLAGKDDYTKSQGFYVYRNGRLLIYGTWFRLARQTVGSQLARVKIDLPNSEDFTWSIDVKKSRATPPDSIRLELKRIIDRITKSSTNVYKKRGARISEKNYVPIWSEYHNHNEKSYRLNYDNPTILDFLSGLDDEATKKVKDIFSIVESTLPIDSIFSNYSTEPENIKQNNITDEQLLYHAENYWNVMSEMGNTYESISTRFKQTEPFCKFDEFCDKFLEKKEYMNECD